MQCPYIQELKFNVQIEPAGEQRHAVFRKILLNPDFEQTSARCGRNITALLGITPQDSQIITVRAPHE
jgi:hypothetical protein